MAGRFGLLIGSFLNVVVYRVPRGLGWKRPVLPDLRYPGAVLRQHPGALLARAPGQVPVVPLPASPPLSAGGGADRGLFVLVAVVVGPHTAASPPIAR